MQSDRSETKSARKLWDMIDEIKIAMLTTEDGGVLRSRPMECVQTDNDGRLWFFTQASSHKAAEVEAHRQVNLSFADTQNQNYVSVSGRAAVVRDRAKAEKLWTEDQRVWFPRGLEDPELALLRVDVAQAEYWDRPTSAMVAAQGLVKAVTDEAPDMGENRKLDFESARS